MFSNAYLNARSYQKFGISSNGVADGVKSSPCIYARDNNILVVWQKNTGSSHDITFHKSTDYGATWPTSNRKVTAGAASGVYFIRFSAYHTVRVNKVILVR